MNLDKAIKERHCVRKFKSKKPDWRKILKAIDSATKAPLAGNISTVKFILVTEKDKINELAKAATQDFIAATHYVVVACSDPTQCERSYGKRAERYCRQQAGATIENFLLKITDMKLAACWVGAFSDVTVKRILKIPDNCEVEAILPIGYEMGKITQRKKPDLDDVLFFNKWKNKFMTKKRKPGA
jgi:nitroreductase